MRRTLLFFHHFLLLTNEMEFRINLTCTELLLSLSSVSLIWWVVEIHRVVSMKLQWSWEEWRYREEKNTNNNNNNKIKNSSAYRLFDEYILGWIHLVLPFAYWFTCCMITYFYHLTVTMSFIIILNICIYFEEDWRQLVSLRYTLCVFVRTICGPLKMSYFERAYKWKALKLNRIAFPQLRNTDGTTREWSH